MALSTFLILYSIGKNLQARSVQTHLKFPNHNSNIKLISLMSGTSVHGASLLPANGRD